MGGYRLVGDECRPAVIFKMAELNRYDIFCVRQDDLDPSDEAVMGRE